MNNDIKVKEGQVWISNGDENQTATIESWDKGGTGLSFPGWRCAKYENDIYVGVMICSTDYLEREYHLKT